MNVAREFANILAALNLTAGEVSDNFAWAKIPDRDGVELHLFCAYNGKCAASLHIHALSTQRSEPTQVDECGFGRQAKAETVAANIRRRLFTEQNFNKAAQMRAQREYMSALIRWREQFCRALIDAGNRLSVKVRQAHNFAYYVQTRDDVHLYIEHTAARIECSGNIILEHLTGQAPELAAMLCKLNALLVAALADMETVGCRKPIDPIAL